MQTQEKFEEKTVVLDPADLARIVESSGRTPAPSVLLPGAWKKGLEASAKVLLGGVALFGTIHLVIRAMVAGLGMDSPWLPYAYQYFLGGTVFLTGIALITSARAADPARRRDRFWLGVLVFGFVWYAAWHAAWIVAALTL